MKRSLRPIVLFGLVFGYILHAAAAEPVTIQVGGTWVPGSSTGELLADLMDEYNALQDRVRVEFDGQVPADGEGWMQPLIVSYAAGTAPDVAVTRGPTPKEWGAEMFLALDRFIDGPNGLPRDTFVGDVWAFGSLDGQTYAIALDSNERALFINAGMVDGAGLSRSNPPSNWDEMLQWAQKMTISSGDQVEQWGFYTQHNRSGDFAHMIFLNDGEIFTEDGSAMIADHPNTVEALEYFADMIISYQVAPRGNGANALNDFVRGNGAMIPYHSGMIGALSDQPLFDYITVPGPVGTGKRGGRHAGATDSVLQIVNTTNHPEEAWDFIKWLAIEHAVTIATARERLPLTREGLRDPRFQAPPWRAFAESIMAFSPRLTTQTGLGTSSWWSGGDNLRTVVNGVLNGQMAAGPALRELSERVTSRITRERSQ